MHENKWFGNKEIVKEMTKKLVEHVSTETTQVEQFPNDIELDMEVFTAGGKIKNTVEQTTN